MHLKNAGQVGQIQTEKHIYHGYIFDLVQRQIKTPDQMTVTRDVILHRPAVAILALTADQQVVINTEYRSGFNQESIALPAGLLNEGENTLAAAPRELSEETGYVAHNLQELTTVASSEGFTDERVTLVLARIDATERVATHFDADEFVNSQLIPLTELVKLIKNGTVQSAQTVAAVSYYLAFCQAN
ncbi:NUDIX hydrolase [Loigolactobacillus zhaoyuanensis]|uniref:NUDIX hydrolase n=1 Tax=Loigolactobacillus zhaoyuanensis TaxID=2486017 RepID=A0ABW8UHE2_9LACO|nr:NUDIX hydrolase [Loigolactobacillus zhaoyuanensis]